MESASLSRPDDLLSLFKVIEEFDAFHTHLAARRKVCRVQEAIFTSVYESMRETFAVAEGDRFIAAQDFEASDFTYHPTYLGINRTDWPAPGSEDTELARDFLSAKLSVLFSPRVWQLRLARDFLSAKLFYHPSPRHVVVAASARFPIG